MPVTLPVIVTKCIHPRSKLVLINITDILHEIIIPSNNHFHIIASYSTTCINLEHYLAIVVASKLPPNMTSFGQDVQPPTRRIMIHHRSKHTTTSHSDYC